ncbi:outer membrane protein [Roseibium marinum]|uniref:Opacity protein-like surface antigen n=1 Tax=Roseibium marinum TaxID=281252 RepID=A0A2S3V2Q8_9HYPH|nr:outer membrane beta-barrel protein [Roseibium marinum]POF34228.1 opacity protein-like surface antigen [Roseibium marinum]
MQFSKRILLAASSLVLANLAHASQAIAEDTFLSGFYLKGEAGASIGGSTGEITFRDQTGSTGRTKDTTLGLGGAFGVGVGTHITDMLRAELMFNYRTGHQWDTGLANFNFNEKFDANLSSYSLMAAGIFDIYTFKMGAIEITPNITGMAGIAINQSGDFTATAPGEPNAVWNGDTSTNLAWGLGAGAGIKLSEKATLDLGYRYVDLGNFKSGTKLTSGLSGNLKKRVVGDYTTNELMLGLRYKF